MFASQSSHSEVAELLLKDNADIDNIQAKILMLTLATVNGYTDIVKLLLKDIDVHVQSEDIQYNVLMFASYCGLVEIVEHLKEWVGVNI